MSCDATPLLWTHLRCEGSEGKVLKMDGPSAQGFLSLTAFQAEGCGIALAGDEYKVSVTRIPSRPHRHSEP